MGILYSVCGHGLAGIRASLIHLETDRGGSLSRSDRLAKYNQLLRIGQLLGKNAVYARNSARTTVIDGAPSADSARSEN